MLARWTASSWLAPMGGVLARRAAAVWGVSTARSLSTHSDLVLYNSLSREKEPFVPRHAPTVTWYSCGPTVYDHAHVGHARNYVSLDIVQRVMSHEFGLHVRHVMGMTDVDDKVLTRAAERGVRPIDLAREHEQSFWRDMDALGVQRPFQVLRVTEHIDEIQAFVTRIIERGFAYATESGVYFDTQAFGPRYGKLKPHHDASDDTSAGAGVGVDGHAAHKRHPHDFALWKCGSVPGLEWDSPWGRGRPGWHIECSAMTHKVFGEHLDVHTGGIDLAFPHHTNEIAQCEACFDADEWARFFVHTGHLHIEGLKMSKSLKNFITIDDFLAEHSAQHFRWFCLSHRFHANVDYSADQMRQARHLDRYYSEFVATTDAVCSSEQHPRHPTLPRLCEGDASVLLDTLFTARGEVRAALADNVDTPRALTALHRLVHAANAPLHTATPPADVLLHVRDYVVRTLGMFGIHTAAAASPRGGGGEEETRVEDALAAMVQFRSDVRDTVRAAEGEAGKQAAVLQLCDRVRDETLAGLGVRVTDGATGRWEHVGAEAMAREKAQRARDRAHEREAAAQRRAQRTQVDVGADVPPEALYREHMAHLYTAFDADGVPTHTADGEPVSKAARRKLIRRQKRQAHRHAQHLTTQAGGDE